jgi:hypothetical protein
MGNNHPIVAVVVVVDVHDAHPALPWRRRDAMPTGSTASAR